MKYLVSYEGYSLGDCYWEPAESFSNDHSKIGELLDLWAKEDPHRDTASLDSYETILLREVYELARMGMTWKGI